MANLILFNKPFQVLSQFSSPDGRKSLRDYVDIKNVYPAGRLDYDSEGLLLLTDDGRLQARIAEPKFKLPKTYWAQLEGSIDAAALTALSTGVQLKDGLTRPARATLIEAPDIWPRTPPIRQREHIPTCWIELTISEGKNRQVRRMTAAVGYPTLRLIRYRIGEWSLDNLMPGEYRSIKVNLPGALKGKNTRTGSTQGGKQAKTLRKPGTAIRKPEQ